MDFTKIETILAELIGQSRWADVYDTLTNLPVESVDDRAYVEIMRGLVLYQQNALELAREGLQRIDDGLEMASDPAVVYRGCLCGIAVARAVGNFERSAAYVKTLRVLMRSSRNVCGPLIGRGLNSIASHHLWQHEYDKALKTFGDSIAWHHDNIGPYNEHDRRCQLRIACTGLGEVCLRLGKRSRARTALCEAEGALDDGTRMETIHFLRGLIAASEGRYADAVAQYKGAALAAKENHDHQFRFQVVEMMALAYHKLGNIDEIRSVLEPAIDEAACAELPNATLRLQRLLVFSPDKGVSVG